MAKKVKKPKLVENQIKQIVMKNNGSNTIWNKLSNST